MDISWRESAHPHTRSIAAAATKGTSAVHRAPFERSSVDAWLYRACPQHAQDCRRAGGRRATRPGSVLPHPRLQTSRREHETEMTTHRGLRRSGTSRRSPRKEADKAGRSAPTVLPRWRRVRSAREAGLRGAGMLRQVRAGRRLRGWKLRATRLRTMALVARDGE